MDSRRKLHGVRAGHRPERRSAGTYSITDDNRVDRLGPAPRSPGKPPTDVVRRRKTTSESIARVHLRPPDKNEPESPANDVRAPTQSTERVTTPTSGRPQLRTRQMSEGWEVDAMSAAEKTAPSLKDSLPDMKLPAAGQPEGPPTGKANVPPHGAGRITVPAPAPDDAGAKPAAMGIPRTPALPFSANLASTVVAESDDDDEGGRLDPRATLAVDSDDEDHARRLDPRATLAVDSDEDDGPVDLGATRAVESDDDGPVNLGATTAFESEADDGDEATRVAFHGLDADAEAEGDGDEETRVAFDPDVDDEGDEETHVASHATLAFEPAEEDPLERGVTLSLEPDPPRAPPPPPPGAPQPMRAAGEEAFDPFAGMDDEETGRLGAPDELDDLDDLLPEPAPASAASTAAEAASPDAKAAGTAEGPGREQRARLATVKDAAPIMSDAPARAAQAEGPVEPPLPRSRSERERALFLSVGEAISRGDWVSVHAETGETAAEPDADPALVLVDALACRELRQGRDADAANQRRAIRAMERLLQLDPESPVALLIAKRMLRRPSVTQEQPKAPLSVAVLFAGLALGGGAGWLVTRLLF